MPDAPDRKQSGRIAKAVFAIGMQAELTLAALLASPMLPAGSVTTNPLKSNNYVPCNGAMHDFTTQRVFSSPSPSSLFSVNLIASSAAAVMWDCNPAPTAFGYHAEFCGMLGTGQGR